MLFKFVLSFGIFYIIEVSLGIKFIDIDMNEKDTKVNNNNDTNRQDKGLKDSEFQDKTTKEGRRYWLVSSGLNLQKPEINADEYEKDERLKSKITTLVEQTIHDTETKIKSIQHLKEHHRNEPPYKTGFILSMIKKSKDVLNELFNVAVKHRDDWKALEQLKIFELIVHTNVDTTNLVRQLVENHIQYMNSTNQPNSRKRVVLLK